MPQFTQWNVPDPFPNILYNPAAVDAAIAKTQSELGNLDINRQELKLRQDAAARDVAFGDYLKKSLPPDGTTGTTGAGVGGTYAPGTPFTPKMLPPGISLDEDAMVRTIAGEAGNEPLQGQVAVAHVINNRAKGAGVSPRDVVFSPNQFEPWNGGAARARLEAMQPTDPAYQSILNNVVRPAMAGKAADPTGGATHFYAPVAQKALGREAPSWGQGTPSAVIGGHNFYKLGYGPGQARVAAAPDTTPAVAPQAAPGIIPPTAPGVNPNAMVKIPPTAPIVAAPAANPNAGPRVGSAPTVPAVTPAIAPSADPNARVEADDPNTAAVKQASAALLNMPEADAAAAYPAVVRELQARGFAMNAPPEYPGHAALQALVGGGEPAVAQTKTAMRLGGTDVAGPPGVVSTPAQPDAPPNRLAYGTGLPGVTIGMPGNGLAPPPTAVAPSPVQTAATPVQAQPQAAAPQPTQPPPAPSRVIQREPLIQSGIFAGLTRTQASTIANTPGVKPAQIMDQIATARHQNDVIRQGDATQAAIDEKENYARRHTSEQEAQAAADKKEAQRVAAEHLRLSQEDTAIKQAAEKRAADKEAADQKARIKGDAIAAQHENTLLDGTESGETNTAKYASAYSKFAEGRYNADGSFVKPNMTAYAKPTFIPPGATEVPDYGKQDTPGPLPPEKVMTGMQGNASGIRNIDRVLRDLDAHPNSVGIKALQPEWALQYTDPEGVHLRAGIADLTSQQFHDRSGASVTLSESPRLKPFLPAPTDTVAALRTKLERIRTIYREILEDNYSVYGPEGTGRSIPLIEKVLKQTPKASDKTDTPTLKPPPKGSTVIIP
jgi:spore germination cell wall hydrolase CwlJ-like protein